MSLTLAEANALSADAFRDAFADIAEHSPWVAERAGESRPFADQGAVMAAFAQAIDKASQAEQLALIRAHPDLATKAKLTQDSQREQAGVGLDSLTEAEFARFTDLNTQYRDRFGFPFIFAVKGATKTQILDSFVARIGNDRETEFDMALMMVKRIVAFRLEDRIAS